MKRTDAEYRGRYRITYDPKHPLADSSGNVRTHRHLLFSKIGPGEHPCCWCGIGVSWQKSHGARRGALQVDHINGNKLDNSIENLAPSCHLCNTRRGNKTLVADSETYVTGSDGTRHRATEITCDQCGTVFLARLAALKFKGVVRCSRKCGRKARMGR